MARVREEQMAFGGTTASIPAPAASGLTESELVVFLAGGYGDCVMARPALAAMASYHAGPTTLITTSGPHLFLFDDLGFDRVISVDMRAYDGRKEFDAAAVARFVLPNGYFVVAVTWRSVSLDELRAYLQPKLSIGHAAGNDVRLSPRGRNWVENYFALAKALYPKAHINDFRSRLPFGAAAERLANRHYANLPENARVLVVHADTMPEKMWAPKNWTALLDIFLRRHPDYYAFVVGAYDLGLSKAECKDRIVSLIGLPLDASMAVVARADLFAGIDSCMMHVADACGVPALTVFVGSRPQGWGCYWTRHDRGFGAAVRSWRKPPGSWKRCGDRSKRHGSATPQRADSEGRPCLSDQSSH